MPQAPGVIRMPDIVLDDKRAGPHLEVLEQGRAVRQTASTTHFEGAWCLANLGFSSGQWRCTFSIRKRRRWMAAGFALDTVKLNKPINRSNIFVFASTGSIKANDQTAPPPPPDPLLPASACATDNAAWSPFARPFKTDDCVVAELDLVKGNIYFSVNHGPRLLAYSNLGEIAPARLNPAVYLSGQADEIGFECEMLVGLDDPVASPNMLHCFEAAQDQNREAREGCSSSAHLSPLPADVVRFKVGSEGAEVIGHTFLLAARSEYFRAMLMHHASNASSAQQPAADADATALTTIPINSPNATHATFCEVLRYVYSGGATDIAAEHVVAVFELANEYGIGRLEERCIELMADSVEPENALSLFSLSEKYLPATKDLKRRCVECIRSRVGDVTEGGTFTELCAHPVLMRELFCSMVSSQRPRGDAEKPEGTAAKRPRTGA